MLSKVRFLISILITRIKQLICAFVFQHNYQVDPDRNRLSDKKCVTCGKICRFWNIRSN